MTLEYKRLNASGGQSAIQISDGPQIFASFVAADAEIDELENQIARLANNRNKKLAAARRKQRNAISNRARTLIAQGMDHARAYATAAEEVEG